MKYDKTIVFVTERGSHYDPNLGKTVYDGETRTKKLARVVTPSMERSSVVFGDLKKDDIVVHLKQPYEDTYDYCLIKLFSQPERKYFFNAQRRVGRKQFILMSGEHNGS